MDIKLFDSERKVMETLWKHGDLRAGQMAKILKDETGWNRNTTYTVIKKCIEKGAIERVEPNFLCRARITREEAQDYETKELIEKVFDGSKSDFLASFVNEEKLTLEEIEYLKSLVQRLE